MQSIYYTAPLLLFAVYLNYITLHTDAKEQLQKPNISMQQNDQMPYIACTKKLLRGTNITCNLYTGDAPEPYRRTWTKIGSCVFDVSPSDLQSALQSVWSTEVSCDYSVSTEPGSLSPRSDRYTVSATAKTSTLTAVTTSSPDQYSTAKTSTLAAVTTSAPDRHKNLLVIIGPAVGMAVLGVTAVCLCRRHRKQKSKRPKAEPMYSSVNMTSLLSAGGAPLYSEIKDVPSTFKPPLSGSNNSSYMQEGDMVYSEIKDVPCTSKSPTSGLTPKSDTVDRDMVYSEINNAPCAFKSPSSGLTPSSDTVDRDMVYSEINDVPCAFKSPSSGLKPSSDTTASGPATLTTAPLPSAVYSSLQTH
ncbi:hypothetical protein AGOR_G00207940 [Albula goreensis]|uniref:Uncharacterized protein n=1 Tax=Albula goreensis TaxID=1534307 RepID=A0A8T3CQK1_9TELE|nr:hypothetical protein AGOR_G00207940 [Albula goreensis]